MLIIQVTSDLIETAIESQSNGGSVGQWLTFIVLVLYVIYDLIKSIIEYKKEKGKDSSTNALIAQTFKSLKQQSLVNEEILRYLKINSDQYYDNISHEQANILIEKVFDASALKVFNYLKKICEDNDIQSNKVQVENKIRTFIMNSMNSDSLTFREFEVGGISLRERFDEFIRAEENGIEEYIQQITLIIFTHPANAAIKLLYGYILNTFDMIKNNMKKRL